MPGSSRLPVSLRETFNARARSVRGQQLAALNVDLYVLAPASQASKQAAASLC